MPKPGRKPKPKALVRNVHKAVSFTKAEIALVKQAAAYRNVETGRFMYDVVMAEVNKLRPVLEVKSEEKE